MVIKRYRCLGDMRVLIVLLVVDALEWYFFVGKKHSDTTRKQRSRGQTPHPGPSPHTSPWGLR